VDVTYFAFRIMVGLGMLMLLVGLLSVWLRVRGKLYDSPWFQRLAVLVGPTGFLAIIAGWTTTETGRQPWTVQGLLRTVDSVSPITLHEVEASFAVIIVVYLIVIGSGIRYLLKMWATAPEPGEPPPHDDAPLRGIGRYGLMHTTNLAPGE
jgi:cytochrome d ubiquinol oxidase subunit I